MDSVVMVEIENDVLERLEAACRAAITALPRGDRGIEAAVLWLRALPEACRLGLGDVTDSAPGLFRLFVAEGLIPSCPDGSSMTAAIRLIASVSPLVTQRSARIWTAWLGSARDPESAITATLRASVTPAMLARPRRLPPEMPRRRGSIRSERDRLAADLRATREESERERGSARARIDELAGERDRLAVELARVGDEQERLRRAVVDRIDQLTAERDRLAADVLATRKEAERLRRESSARVHELEAKCDGLATDLKAATDRHHEELAGRDRVHQRTAAALAETREELARCQHKLHDAERRCSEAVEGARSLDERIRTLTEARETLTAELDQRARRANRLRDKLSAAEAALTDERAAHTGTRQSLKFVEERSLGLARECQELEDAAEQAQGAMQALAKICAWLDINPKAHDVESQLEAIFAAVDHQRRSRQEFLSRVENRLLRRVRQSCETLYALQAFRAAHPNSNFDASVERNLSAIHAQADELVRKDMEKLTADETSSA